MSNLTKAAEFFPVDPMTCFIGLLIVAVVVIGLIALSRAEKGG